MKSRRWQDRESRMKWREWPNLIFVHLDPNFMGNFGLTFGQTDPSLKKSAISPIFCLSVTKVRAEMVYLRVINDITGPNAINF